MRRTFRKKAGDFVGKFFRRVLGYTLSVPGVAILWAGLLVIGYQGYSWANEGTWVSFSLYHLAVGGKFAGISIPSFTPSYVYRWLTRPDSFAEVQYGVVWVLKFLPMSVISIFFGYSLAVAGEGISGKYRNS